ncbi:ribonuclease P protein component [Leptotrichia sp. OH3620_COT-345]|uniref:ribonuclease P protein component n=1 Tax=Leptotrichia sp. OH3620_COT-345 TaxID=2491048 RepID=UPI000F64A6B8|nr:ribonuclease P protein component [Leptotrichia sp. OH3620_COT-345]RRD40734.1 ribonuclease P protein component [Leptotrichia sp. OH3620_COT-345]
MQIKKIKKNKDFFSIYNNSKKVYTKYAIIFIKENKRNEQRFGFVASKKTGKAIQRNRIKRLFKEFVRLNNQIFKRNTDYIFVGKSILKENIKKLKYKDIEKDILKVMKK